MSKVIGATRSPSNLATFLIGLTADLINPSERTRIKRVLSEEELRKKPKSRAVKARRAANKKAAQSRKQQRGK